MIVWCIIAAVVITAVGRWQHLSLLAVQSNSMQPTYQRGDAVLVQPLHRKPQIGEIVAYTSPNNPVATITHRVVSLQSNGMVLTQGDALRQSDTPVAFNAVRGEVIGVIAGAGILLGWLHTPAGFVVMIVLPLLYVLIIEMLRFGWLVHARGRGYTVSQSRLEAKVR